MSTRFHAVPEPLAELMENYRGISRWIDFPYPTTAIGSWRGQDRGFVLRITGGVLTESGKTVYPGSAEELDGLLAANVQVLWDEERGERAQVSDFAWEN